MPDSLRKESTRVCAECGMPLLRGDGGIRAFGRLFCSELCADRQDPAFNDPLYPAAPLDLIDDLPTTQRGAIDPCREALERVVHALGYVHVTGRGAHTEALREALLAAYDVVESPPNRGAVDR